MGLTTRPEEPTDADAIRRVLEAAFPPRPRPIWSSCSSPEGTSSSPSWRKTMRISSASSPSVPCGSTGRLPRRAASAWPRSPSCRITNGGARRPARPRGIGGLRTRRIWLRRRAGRAGLVSEVRLRPGRPPGARERVRCRRGVPGPRAPEAAFPDAAASSGMGRSSRNSPSLQMTRPRRSTESRPMEFRFGFRLLSPIAKIGYTLLHKTIFTRAGLIWHGPCHFRPLQE